MDQILLSTGKKCYANFQNIDSGFCRAQKWNNTSFEVVFPVRKLCDLCWWCLMLGTPIDKQNGWKCVLKDRTVTICEVANMLEIACGSVQSMWKGVTLLWRGQLIRSAAATRKYIQFGNMWPHHTVLVTGKWINVQHWWNGTDRDQSTHGQNLLQCQFVHHKPHMGWPEPQCGKRMNWENRNVSAGITGLRAKVQRVMMIHIQNRNVTWSWIHRKWSHKLITPLSPSRTYGLLF